MIEIEERQKSNSEMKYLPEISAVRYHDFSCGHRVVGHESKCKHLHGHNYRVWVELNARKEVDVKLDNIGRVLDFSVIKKYFFYWLEEELDHKFLVWREDPWLNELIKIDPQGICIFPLNPTAENISIFLLNRFNEILEENGKGDVLIVTKVVVEETRKCSATASLQTNPFSNY